MASNPLPLVPERSLRIPTDPAPDDGQPPFRAGWSANSTNRSATGLRRLRRRWTKRTGATKPAPLPRVAEFWDRCLRLIGVRWHPTRGVGALRWPPQTTSARNRPVYFVQIHSFLTCGKPYRCSRCNFCCSRPRARAYCDLDVPSAMSSNSAISGWLYPSMAYRLNTARHPGGSS